MLAVRRQTTANARSRRRTRRRTSIEQRPRRPARSLALQPGRARARHRLRPRLPGRRDGRGGRPGRPRCTASTRARACSAMAPAGATRRSSTRAGDAVALPFARRARSTSAVCDAGLRVRRRTSPAALAEARRVLRPGGRLLILDTDWDSIVWHSSDRDADAARCSQKWNDHLADPYLPRRLPGLLRGRRLRARRTSAIIPILNRRRGPRHVERRDQRLVAACVADRGGVSERGHRLGARTSPASATTTSSASTATCSWPTGRRGSR